MPPCLTMFHHFSYSTHISTTGIARGIFRAMDAFLVGGDDVVEHDVPAPCTAVTATFTGVFNTQSGRLWAIMKTNGVEYPVDVVLPSLFNLGPISRVSAAVPKEFAEVPKALSFLSLPISSIPCPQPEAFANIATSTVIPGTPPEAFANIATSREIPSTPPEAFFGMGASWPAKPSEDPVVIALPDGPVGAKGDVDARKLTISEDGDATAESEGELEYETSPASLWMSDDECDQQSDKNSSEGDEFYEDIERPAKKRRFFDP